MKFYEYLNLYYNRSELLNFTNSITNWSSVKSRKSDEIIPGYSAYRYNKDLFNCKEIKRLSDIFQIDYNKIQIAKFDPNFNFRPHKDYERRSCVLFPIFPILDYNPITYIINGKEIDIYYYGPILTDTTITHTVKGNGQPRINMQFDLDCSIDEGIEYVTRYSNTF